MSKDERDRAPSSFEIFHRIILLPFFVFLLLCYWENVISPIAEWNTVYTVLFYSGVAGAALLSIVCGIFIATASSYSKHAIVLWYLIAQMLAVAWFVARGITLGIPKGMEASWPFVGEWFFWLFPLFLPLAIYLLVKKTVMKSLGAR